MASITVFCTPMLKLERDGPIVRHHAGTLCHPASGAGLRSLVSTAETLQVRRHAKGRADLLVMLALVVQQEMEDAANARRADSSVLLTLRADLFIR